MKIRRTQWKNAILRDRLPYLSHRCVRYDTRFLQRCPEVVRRPKKILNVDLEASLQDTVADELSVEGFHAPVCLQQPQLSSFYGLGTFIAFSTSSHVRRFTITDTENHRNNWGSGITINGRLDIKRKHAISDQTKVNQYPKDDLDIRKLWIVKARLYNTWKSTVLVEIGDGGSVADNNAILKPRIIEHRN